MLVIFRRHHDWTKKKEDLFFGKIFSKLLDINNYNFRKLITYNEKSAIKIKVS